MIEQLGELVVEMTSRGKAMGVEEEDQVGGTFVYWNDGHDTSTHFFTIERRANCISVFRRACDGRYG